MSVTVYQSTFHDFNTSVVSLRESIEIMDALSLAYLVYMFKTRRVDDYRK